MIRLIATDMDGTLLGDRLDRIPPENVRALREAADAGITLALALGDPACRGGMLLGGRLLN